jgi:Protein of unknown function (DUF3500)
VYYILASMYPALISGSLFMSFSLLPSNVETATAFINALNPVQKKKVIQEFDDHRMDWHYLPSTMFHREGIYIRDLDDNQRQLLHKLLQSYLSQKGYNKTNNIIGLENVLRELGGGSYRNPELYMVAFYGIPAENDIWGWKFEGHHVSLNFTVVDDQISYTPRFFGANPAEVPSGSKKGLRVLKDEEDFALQLMSSLTKEQKKKAIFSLSAYSDILTANDAIALPLDKEGIQAKDLSPEQRALLKELIMEYLSAMPQELAEKRMQQVNDSPFTEIWFGWAGGIALHAPHYYRVQGEKFLIELDNTQNNANHIHCVWRDFDGDFGGDLIREHYKNSDHHDH